MTVKAGIVLVHGYTGSPHELNPLAAALNERFGDDSITSRPARRPRDRGCALVSIRILYSFRPGCGPRFRKPGTRVILVGHSTGGTIALSALQQGVISPDLLILASVPHRIDAGYLERWREHRRDLPDVPFTSVAEMISLINKAATASTKEHSRCWCCRAAVTNWSAAATADAWRSGNFKGPVRTALIPGGGHDLFQGDSGRLAIDIAVRGRLRMSPGSLAEERETIGTITAAEPEAARFLSASPQSAAHLAGSPSGRSARTSRPSLSLQAPREPVIANIEITTRCNLRCSYCARTLRGGPGEDMSLQSFKTVLGLLPHAYRITLVGLGETLLHPGSRSSWQKLPRGAACGPRHERHAAGQGDLEETLEVGPRIDRVQRRWCHAGDRVPRTAGHGPGASYRQY